MKDDQIFPAGGSVSTLLPSQTSPPARILVVEDDIFIRQLNTEVLLRSGYEVDVAEDGAAAWDTLQHNRYDLLITDNNMPKLSGVDLVKKLRDEDMTLPVIMATGALPVAELEQKPRLHLTALLLKPYTIEELLGTVKAILLAAKSARHPPENSLLDDRNRLAKPGR